MRRQVVLTQLLLLVVPIKPFAVVGVLADSSRSGHERTMARTVRRRGPPSPSILLSAREQQAEQRVPPSTALLCVTAGLQSACFGCIGTALPPALRASGLDSTSVAMLLGRLGSASALAEVLLSGSFGKLADAIGRKPILVAAPLVTVFARAAVVALPSLPILLGARLCSTLVVPIFWLAFQASWADLYGKNATELAVLSSRVRASMGLGYALSSIAGGALAARNIRYAYACSCALGCCVALLTALGMRETLPDGRRVPFTWGAGFNPLSFLALFQRSALAARLNLVVVLQSLTNGMGDLWQVMARELRGWGAAQCGNFAAMVGISTIFGNLVSGPSLRRLGPRRHTVMTTASSACASTMLGGATSDAAALAAVAPIALGASRDQATSARIVNHLGEELGVPQGQLAAERNALNALIKVIAPSLYAWLFTVGASRGIVGLPFYCTATLLAASAVMAASIPIDAWVQGEEHAEPSPLTKRRAV